MAITGEEQRNLMLTEPCGRLLFKKALPTVITQLISIIYNTADTFFVAKISTQASAAVGVVFSLMAIIQAIGFGVGMGSGSLISRRLGAKKEDEANRYANSALAMGLVLGLVILLAGMSFLSSFMRLLGASDSVLPYAKEYALFILIAAPFMCMAFVLNAALRSEGQTVLSMIGMTSGGILNALLDPLFIFTFNMGIKGAAAATMISQMVGFVILLSFFLAKRTIVKLSPGYISRKAGDYILIVKTGLPTIFRQGLASLATAILNNQAAVYGDAAVAALSIANKVYMLSRNIVLGIGQGYMPIAGYCYGAGSMKRVKKMFRMAVWSGTIIVAFIGLMVFIFREPVMTWFRDDAEVVRIGVSCLTFTCIATPLMGYSTLVNQTLQALGFSFSATFLASCRQGIFYVPLAFILPALLQLTGIQLIQPAADILTFCMAIPLQLRLFRRYLIEQDSKQF